MRPGAPAWGDEAGFSLIEVLVALAIASLSVIALGYLYRTTAEAHQRSQQANEVQAALFDVESLGQSLGVELGRHAALAGGNVVLQLDPPAAGPDIQLSLETTATGRRLVSRRGAAGTSVDLSVFDHTEFEYWITRSSVMSWVGGDAGGGGVPAAVRLRLQRGLRVWRPLLWAADELGPDNG